ncbi:MAG: FliA/WhiG family RNA polymerase sigma factor [Gaiellales bacterium]
MPRASKTEKADTPAKPTKPAKAPAKDQKPVTTVKSSNDKPAARSSTVRVATSSRARGREPPSPEAIDELARLWAEFKQSEVSGARVSARERLILHYAPLVKYVASRVATGLPASVDQADLVSYGMFGLIDALEKFDLGRGNKFETYAIPRIKGAIIDELRAMDWVPRSVRFKAREIEKAYSDLESIHKRAPTEKEVAARLGVTLRELHEVINQISFVQVVQLDEILSVGSDRGEQVSLLDTLADRSTDPTTSLEGQETRGMLAAAINSLSEREKIVVTLYYFEGLTLAEIGEILALTESRVCQIHTKAVGQLRLQLVETE